MQWLRFSVLLLLSASFTMGAESAHANRTPGTVTGVFTTVSPTQPKPDDPFTVKTRLTGSLGTPCSSATVTATVAGMSQSRYSIRIHANQPANLSFVFDLSTVASGTDLTPTISWSGCGSGSSSTIAGGSTPPTVQETPKPALNITKSLSGAGKDTVSPGDIVTYQLDYRSSGSAEADTVVLTDQLDSRLEFVSATGGGGHNAGTVTWNLGRLEPGDTNSVEVTARVAATATSGTISNVARIVANSVAEVTSNPVDIRVNTDPEIQLTKTIDDDTTQAAVLEAGRVITYRIRYENLGGGRAESVIIKDVLPPELIAPPTIAGGVTPPSYDAATRTVTWFIGEVPRKVDGVVTLTAQIDPALGNTDFENEAKATYTGCTPAPCPTSRSVAHITVSAEPYLSVNKTVFPTVVAPGDALTYFIFYENIGSLVAEDPIIRDSLPPGLTPVPGTFTGSYDPAARELKWNLPDLDPGALGHSVSYQATVDPGLTSTDLVNQVTMTAQNLPGVLTANASTKVLVRDEPVLVPAKKLAAGSKPDVLDGDRVTFEISLVNSGNEGTQGGVTLTDTLPPGLTFVSASAGGVESPTGVVTWNLADLPGNSGTGSVTLEVEVDGSQLQDGDFISNAVSVDADDAFGRSFRETSDPVVLQYNIPPSVTVTKSASPPETKPLFPGDTVDYTITATLDSRRGVSDLRIIDAMPPVLEFIKADDPGVEVTTDATGTRVTWPPADLTSGSRSVTLQARVRPGAPPGETITNLAGGTFAGGGFANPGITQHFVSEAAVELSKTIPADQSQVVDGEEITYTIKYTNTGKVTLTGIDLQDTLPDGVALVAASPVPTTNLPGPPVVLKWDLGQLAPGKTGSVTVKVRVDGAAAGDVLRNQAQLTTNEAQPRTATVMTLVREAPVLVLDKVTNAATVHPGDSVEFTLLYRNDGKGEARNVVLTDTLPAGLTFVSASDQAAPVSGVITWNLGTLAPGARSSKTVRLTVPPGNYVPAVERVNRADIVSVTTSATASEPVSITALPAFTLTKAVDQSQAAPGATLHYTLTLDKTGGPATDVSLGDILSPLARYVDGSSSLPLSAASDLANGELFWELGDLPEGPASTKITFSAKLNDVIDDATPVRNRAAVVAREVNTVLSNEVTTLIDSQPVLVIGKKASASTLFSPVGTSGLPGDPITYTITVENTGNAVASDVTVTDTLPAELVIDPASTSASLNGQTATWTLASLRPGAPASFTVSARVATDVPDRTLRNTARVETTMPGVGSATSPEVTTTVTGQARLELEKQASSPTVKAGGQIVYTLTYRNTGTTASGPVHIEDLVPPETRFVSASDGGMDSGNGHVNWTLPPLDPQKSGSVTLILQVADVVGNNTPLRNVAYAWQGSDRQNAVQATIVGKPTVVSSLPVLEITKTADKKTTRIVAGDTALFHIDFANVGSDTATQVVVTDTLPPRTSLVSASGSPTVSGNTLSWTLPAMAAKTSGNFTVTVRADSDLADGTTLTNSATIRAAESPLPRGDSATIKVLNAVLTLDKSADKTAVRSGASATGTPGYTLNYTLQYTNSGDATAAGTVIVDTLPDFVTFVSATPAPSSIQGRKVTWNIGSVAAKATGSIGLVVRVGDDIRDGTLLHNTATIASDSTPPTAATPVDTLVTSEPVLRISKTSSVVQVTPGQTFAYDITLENVGSDTARNVVITDVLPAETTFVSATAGGTENAGSVTWDIEAEHGPMPANSSVTVHVTVRANDVIASGTPLLNVASATADTTDGRAIAPVSSIFLLPVVSSPLLVIEYAVDQAFVQAGSGLLYTLRVRNTGNAIANDVSVSASLPPGGLPVVIDNNGVFANGSAVWTIGRLPPSGYIDLQFGAFIPAGIVDGTTLGSVAAILASNAPTASSSVLSVVGARPDLTLAKTAPNSVNAGETMVYDIDYFNRGNGAALDVVIEDVLPSGTTFVSADNGGSEVAAGVVRWNLGTLDPLAGGRVTVTVDTEPGPNDGTAIDNIASISASNAATQTAQATTIERSHTELDVFITADMDPVPAGGQETFTVIWANTGNQDTAGAVVTASLPASTTFSSATGSGSFGGGLVTWAVGSLPAGGSGSATFTVDVASPLPNGTVLKSIASISAADGLPDSDSAQFMVSSTPVLLFSKTADASRVQPGSVVTFRIELQNVGNATATGVVVSDPLPAGLLLLSADNGADVDLSSNAATWDVGTLVPGGAPIELSLNARMRATGTSVTNVAWLDANELPSVSASSSVEAGAALPVPVLSVAWLALLILSFAGVAFYTLRRT